MRRHSQVLSAATPIPRNASGERRRGVPHLALAAAFAGALAACATGDGPPKPPTPDIAARLAPTGGSAMRGGAAFWQGDGGVSMAVTLEGVPGQWRVAIHATGNCTSPNGFSAGPPLTLPETTTLAVVPVVTTTDNTGGASVRLPGFALDGPTGIVGKSVVVHAGVVGSLEALPGVPNNRVACGVIERVRPLF